MRLPAAGAADRGRQPDPPARQIPGLDFTAEVAAEHAERDPERANLVAAILRAADTGPHQFAWQLANALRAYLEQQQHLAEWSAASEAGLRAAQAAGDQLAEAARLTARARRIQDEIGYRPAGHVTD